MAFLCALSVRLSVDFYQLDNSVLELFDVWKKYCFLITIKKIVSCIVKSKKIIKYFLVFYSDPKFVQSICLLVDS